MSLAPISRAGAREKSGLAAPAAHPAREEGGDGRSAALAGETRADGGDGSAAMSDEAQKLFTEGLRKVYRGRAVVHDVSIEVGPGEIVGLLGPNGAGKTTTFYMVVGLTSPDAGKVFLGDDDITDLPMYLRAQRGISYLPQEPSIFRRMSVEDNLRAIFETLDLPHAEQERRIDQLITDFGLATVRKSRGYALSGGERRRVEIARALVISPWYILLDEPFAGIDPIAVLEIQGIVKHLKAMGIGILITDHNVRETLKITDRAYIINNGGILRSGTPLELSTDPQVRKIYLGADFTL
jgi:lipopolysaccharide export system ATP-binding protein